VFESIIGMGDTWMKLAFAGSDFGEEQWRKGKFIDISCPNTGS
jgi:hypothetical protein